MSAALVIGFVVLMVGLARQAARVAEADEAPPFSASLNLTEGAAIISITGADDRVAVLVEQPDGRREIHFVDPETGRVTGVATAH